MNNNNSWLYYLSLIVFTILNLAMLVNYPNILKIVTNVGDIYYIPVMVILILPQPVDCLIFW